MATEDYFGCNFATAFGVMPFARANGLLIAPIAHIPPADGPGGPQPSESFLVGTLELAHRTGSHGKAAMKPSNLIKKCRSLDGVDRLGGVELEPCCDKIIY
jgi:hypothetical protein